MKKTSREKCRCGSTDTAEIYPDEFKCKVCNTRFDPTKSGPFVVRDEVSSGLEGYWM